MKQLVYIACPFNHLSQAIMNYRLELATSVAAWYLKRGYQVFSPLTHSVPMVKYGLPNDWETWREIDRDWIDRADIVVFITLKGYQESEGFQAEFDYATLKNKNLVIVSEEIALKFSEIKKGI